MGLPVLVYNDFLIAERDDFLCLTDMWRAAGSDPSKRPVDWLRQDATREFIGFIADELKVSQDHLFKTEQGRNGSTWAHWQPSMAYAKYLSPEFHAWCNQIVRAHMEGRHLPVQAVQGAITLSEAALERFAEKVGEGAIKAARGFLAEAVEPRFERMETRLAVIEKAVTAKTGRKTPTKATREEHIDAAFRLGCRCPCGCARVVVDDNGEKLPALHIDHFYSVDRANVGDTWPLHEICNAEFNDGKRDRHEYQSAFDAYHKARSRLPGRQIQLFA